MLEKVLKRRPADGERITFWLDAWLEDGPLSEIAVNPIGEELKKNEGTGLLVGRRLWKCDQIDQLLPHSALQKLSLLQLRIARLGEDMCGWLQPNNATLKMKEAYASEAGWVNTKFWEGWKVLRKIKVQQSVRFFLWFLAHDSLLINYSSWR